MVKMVQAKSISVHSWTIDSFKKWKKKCIRKGSIKPIQVSKHRSSVYGEKKNKPIQGKKEKDRKKVKCDDGNDT